MSNRREAREKTFDQDGQLVATGAPNAYVVAGARSIITNFRGMKLRFLPNFTNTGAATLKYANAPAVAIKKGTVTDLAAGDIVSGQYADVMYDSANGVWQLQNPQATWLNKTGDTMTGQLIITGTALNFAPLIARLSEDGASFGPQIILDRVSASPAANDQIGRVNFRGKDSAGNNANYAYIQARIDNPTDGSEGATILLGRLVAGVDNSAPIMAPLSPVQGNIAYYDGSTWVVLAPDTAGKFLQTQGAGANPQWAAAAGSVATIASGSLPAATTLSIASIPATYAYLILQITDASSNTTSRNIRVQVSTNNGSSYDSTASNYIYDTFAGLEVIAAGTQASIVDGQTQNAGDTSTSTIYIYGYQGGPNMHWSYRTISTTTSSHVIGDGYYIGSTSAINALRILWSGSGNFDAGSYALYGAP